MKGNAINVRLNGKMPSAADILLTYGPIVVFFWTIFEGETIVVIAGYLIHQGLVSPLPIVVAAFLGTFVSNEAIFFIGRHHVAEKYVTRIKTSRHFTRALQLLERWPTLFIFLSRFVYGFRIVGAIAVSMTGISAIRYFIINLASAAVWAVAFTILGYLAGATVEVWFGRLHHFSHKIGWAILIGVVFFVIWQFVSRRLRQARKNAA